MPRRRRDLRPIIDWLDDRCLLSVSSGLTPAQVTAAYGLSGITFTGASGATVQGNGSGETIALIEMYHDPDLASDLQTFDQQYDLPTPTLNVINQAGSQTDSGWGQEESLDVEWAHAIAPGASILVVEAAPGGTNDQAIQNLMTAVQTASTAATASSLGIPPVAVVSMSWGFSEFPGETQYDSDFTTPGITYVAASGDSPGVDYPAASPDVLSVGGTTLTLNSTGGYSSETAWNDSGGGYSAYESEPAYQQSVQSSGTRSTPDVAFDGDPNTGVQVYFTPASGGGYWNSVPQGSWQTYGGTSLGAPSWAGIIAIVDQARNLNGLSNLSGATQTLPALYGLAAGAGTASDFHPVTSSPTGTTGDGWGDWGGFGGWGSWGGSGGGGINTGSSAGETANTQTGLGSPNGPFLIDALAASTTVSPLPTPSPVPAPTSSPIPIFWPVPPSPIPAPTPGPTPSPSPTSPHKKHHRHRARPAQESAKAKSHASAAHANRIVKPHKAEVKTIAHVRHRD